MARAVEWCAENGILAYRISNTDVWRGRRLTVDVEAKHKEVAVLALRRELIARGWPVLGIE